MSSSLTITLSLATLLFFIITAFTNAQNGGFSINLIHRDSPDSPIYNPTQTHAQRIAKAARRSVDRVQRFSHMLHHDLNSSISSSDASAQLITATGQYLMNISLGTPPFPILAFADTGSDIIWTQCKPCSTDCYKQDAPMFDPRSSSTYRTVPCSSDACNSLGIEGHIYCTDDKDAVCQYVISYAEDSYTYGDIAAETLTLESKTGKVPVALPKTLIGCGYANVGNFSSEGAGYVGLGGGPASLVSQLGPSIGGKFSYCMVPFTASASSSTSTMHFGTNAIVSHGDGVVSTPLFWNSSRPTFYFLRLEAVSIGSKKRIAFDEAPTMAGPGNIIVDSGIPLFYVPSGFFSQVVDAVESLVTAAGGTKISDPDDFFTLCYVADSNLEIPSVTVHFQGADVSLPSENIFVHQTDEIVCLAFHTGSELSVYGNVAQQNFLVGYDLQKKTVSFKPTDCAKN